MKKVLKRVLVAIVIQFFERLVGEIEEYTLRSRPQERGPF